MTGWSILLARRDDASGPDLFGINELRLTGLSSAESESLLSDRKPIAAVVDRLVNDTAGNPLALLEAARSLSSEQLRGSAPLPPVLPIGQRLGAAFLADHETLGAGARRALVIAAAGLDQAAGPVIAALRAEGFDAKQALDDVERAGLLTLTHGTMTFRHPLIRAAVWQQTTAGERRSAHASLATVLQDRPADCLRHRAEAAIGFDDQLAADLSLLADAERSRLGYAASSALFEVGRSIVVG